MGKTGMRIGPLGAAACAALLFGCAEQNVFEGVVGTDAVPPSYLAARATADDRLTVEFSEAVSLTSVRFDPELPVSATSSEDSAIRIDFAKALETGRRYVMDLTASDADGNTVTVLAPFFGRNGHPPALVVNEVRTEYSKPKAEFVELHVREAGNLGGLGIATATSGFFEPVFVFPPVEVAAGEHVVVHLRSLEEGLVQETGGIGASSGTEASPAARDFWVPGTEKRIRKTDVVAVVGTDGAPLDGVAFSETPEAGWETEPLRAAAEFLSEKGAWKGGAVSSAGCTATRTLGRDASSSDGDTKEDWRVVATGGATPGSVNAETSYSPKKK